MEIKELWLLMLNGVATDHSVNIWEGLDSEHRSEFTFRRQICQFSNMHVE